MLNDLRLRLRALFRRKAVEVEMDEELRFHFENQVAKLMRSGWTPAEAQRRARLEFGGMEQIKEEYREARGVSFIGTFVQDIRFGLRILGRDTGDYLRCRCVTRSGNRSPYRHLQPHRHGHAPAAPGPETRRVSAASRNPCAAGK